MEVDLRRVRRQQQDRPGTPSDGRHLLHEPRMEPGWTVKLTTRASYDLCPHTATPDGVIQLDGVIRKFVGKDWIEVQIIWVAPGGWENVRYRSTPTLPQSVTMPLRDIDGLAGHPPTLWDGRSTETLKASVRGARKRHGLEQPAPPAWWSDIGDLDR